MNQLYSLQVSGIAAVVNQINLCKPAIFAPMQKKVITEHFASAIIVSRTSAVVASIKKNSTQHVIGAQRVSRVSGYKLCFGESFGMNRRSS
jgi:hypothetical protein